MCTTHWTTYTCEHKTLSHISRCDAVLRFTLYLDVCVQKHSYHRKNSLCASCLQKEKGKSAESKKEGGENSNGGRKDVSGGSKGKSSAGFGLC